MNELFRLFGTIGINGVDKAQNDLENVTGQAEQSSSKIGSAFKKIGAAVAAAFAIGKIKDFGVEVVKTAAEVAAEVSAFAQIMGKDYADKAQEKMKQVANATGIVSTRLTTYMTSLTAKFKGLGYDINDATGLAQRGLTLAADASAFWDKSLDDSMSHLNSFINGSYEGGEAIGLFANDTQMAAYAVEKGIVKATKNWATLDEATKQATRLEYAENMMKLSGATGQAAKESKEYANVQANLAESWRQFKAQVGEPILQNIVLPVMQKLEDLIKNNLIPGFTQLKEWVTQNKQAIEAVITAIKILIATWAGFKIGTAIQNMVTGFQTARVQLALYSMETRGASIAQGLLNGQLTIGQTIVGLLTGKIKLTTLVTQLWTAAQKGLNVALTANPIGIVVMAIAALIAIFVVVYKKSDTFRNAVNNLWQTIKTGLAPVIEELKPLLTSLINLFKSLWQMISAIVIPVLQLLLSVIKTVIWAITPILKTLLNVFTSVFNGIAKVIGVVINLINKIVTAITSAVNAVKNGIEKIKGFFKFKWELPKLKVPKFSISPSGWKVGDLLKGKIPKLGVTWNAEGAIFNRPAIFDTAYGLQGVGEAGAEAVAPIDKLQGYVQKAVNGEISGLESQTDRIYSLLASLLPQILANLKFNVVLDNGVLVGQLAPAMDAKLGTIYSRKERSK